MESVVAPGKIIPVKIKEYSENRRRIAFRGFHKGSNNDSKLKQLWNKGCFGEAIASLNSDVLSGSKARHKTLSFLIESCIESRSLELCHALYARVIGLLKREEDQFLKTKLVGMFAKCGSVDDALKVFNEITEKDLYAWSAVIGACSREKRWSEVVDLFYSMMMDGNAVPDNFLFPRILQASGNCGDVETGRLIHGMMIKRGMSGELRVNNSILAVYSKCGWLNSAKKFFEGMEMNDIVSWNAIITGYCQQGKLDEVLKLLKWMRMKGVEPSIFTWNIVISSYSQMGRCDMALEMMNEMESCGIKPDVFTWTSMISGFAQNNRGMEALALFGEMLLSGVEPNEITLMVAISACSSAKDFRKGKEVHLHAVKVGYSDNVLVGNSLVDMYSKSRKLQTARQVFDSIVEKDIYSWNTMIAGYCQAGYCGIAHDLFKKMQESKLLPNVITWNAMITGYIQNGDVDQAMDLFQRIEKDGGIKRDTASWNALIAGCTNNGLKNKALWIFRQMQSFGLKPNSVTILSILPACESLVAVKKLNEIHSCILRLNLESEPSVMNSLIDNYAKSGCLKYSEAIFNGILSKDIVTWNSMIGGYVAHGYHLKAIELFELMKQQHSRPNRGTLGSIITAYGQAKFVKEGSHIFSIMTEEYQILPTLDHYTAMVYLYGRSGKLDEALNFIKRMPLEPDVCVWSAFFTACGRHGNAKLAIRAGEQLLELDAENASFQRLVAQLYHLCGISKESWKIKNLVTRKDPPESIGKSWIEYKNTVHSFVTGKIDQLGDKSLYSWIKRIELENRVPKYSDILGIHEERKEETVGVHSEKLALAFALINSSQTCQTIRIVKNLRMCEECHWFAKLVSEKHGHEIYLSDSKCLHYFKNGICSCGDYW